MSLQGVTDKLPIPSELYRRFSIEIECTRSEDKKEFGITSDSGKFIVLLSICSQGINGND